MEALFSWLTSQSGVSLLVALVALVGVLVTTWWNNRAADKRRRADQAAADQRRKDDQADEDARRKADDDRRELERRFQLFLEECARQRGEVIASLRQIHTLEVEANGELRKLKTKPSSESQIGDLAFEIRDLFLFRSWLVLQQLRMEITEGSVAAQVDKLNEQLEVDRVSNRKYLSKNFFGEQAQRESFEVVSESMRNRMVDLQNTARSHLHQTARYTGKGSDD